MSRAGAGRSGRPRSAPAVAGRQPDGSHAEGPAPRVPVVDGAPVDGAPADRTPVDGAPVDGGSVDGAPADSGPVDGGRVDGGPVGGVAAGDVDGAAGPGRPAWAGWDPTIRIAGLVVAILAAFVSGVFELLLTTLRAGDFATIWRGDAIGSGEGPLIPVSIVLAVVLNYAIAWFAVSTTRRRWALGPPWALWTLMMFAASGVRTSEGDYLLGGANWVALVMILVGSLSFAVYSYRMILKRVKP